MKKSLIALAALAATASFAQSAVTLYGAMDAGYQSINYKGNSVNGINGNGSTTSSFNVAGLYDLGGGMKADFRVENDWNTVSNNANTGANTTLSSTGTDTKMANGASWGNGEIRTGLAGNFGKVQFGAINNNTLIANLSGQPFGTAIGSAHGSLLRSNAAGTAVRNDNSWQYNTPVFNGFSASYLASSKQNKAVGANASTAASSFTSTLGGYLQQGVSEFSAAYNNGPIDARFTSLKTDNSPTGGVNYTTNTLGANYAFGAAKVFLWNQTNKAADGSFNTSGTTVSATYTMGATVLMARAGSVKQSAGSLAGQKSTLTALGADYNLSKTTALYARYEAADDKAGLISAAASIDGTGTKRTRTALGLRVTY